VSFNVPVIPPKPDGAGGIQTSRISHAYTGEAITPAEARDLANGLLKAADSAERLDAAALPHLDGYISALGKFDDLG
jgi:hypothetical protein